MMPLPVHRCFQEATLKKLILATSIVAAFAAFSTVGASAASTQTGQQISTGNPMDAQAKMMMSKKKKMMMMKKKKMMMKKDGM